MMVIGCKLIEYWGSERLIQLAGDERHQTRFRHANPINSAFREPGGSGIAPAAWVVQSLQSVSAVADDCCSLLFGSQIGERSEV